MVFGLVELFQATGEVEWLDWADTLQQPHGRAVLGRRVGWMVQHDRRGPRSSCASRRTTTARSRRPARSRL